MLFTYLFLVVLLKVVVDVNMVCSLCIWDIKKTEKNTMNLMQQLRTADCSSIDRLRCLLIQVTGHCQCGRPKTLYCFDSSPVIVL